MWEDLLEPSDSQGLNLPKEVLPSPHEILPFSHFTEESYPLESANPAQIDAEGNSIQDNNSDAPLGKPIVFF